MDRALSQMKGLERSIKSKMTILATQLQKFGDNARKIGERVGSVVETKIKEFLAANRSQQTRVILSLAVVGILIVGGRALFPKLSVPRVVSAFPENEGIDVDPTTSILIGFDRPVLKQSVEKGFSISPKISGTFTLSLIHI